jgi:hypothetical protein
MATKARSKPSVRRKAAARAGSSKRRASAKPRRAVAKTRAKPVSKAPKPQAFVVSHLREEDFRAEGLRNYARYRDLGVAAATKGMARAHVIRFVPPFRAEDVSIRHIHDVDFQLIYVLKGWMKSEFEGQGEIMMREGSCWIQPPRIKHTVLDYSDDCEVLEIILPADFETIEVDRIG